ncbi:MAG: helix-turn-helix domain-containing protein [Nocardioides sp.]|uniref:helix-turn-helix domain-containing protein n=1 Tax=Nocardioides sp. TaxID=35761 RepID=UPI0039E64062
MIQTTEMSEPIQIAETTGPPGVDSPLPDPSSGTERRFGHLTGQQHLASQQRPADAADLVRTALDPDAAPELRRAAVGGLGLARGPVMVVALPLEAEPADRNTASVGGLRALLLPAAHDVESSLPARHCAGIAQSNAVDLVTGWRQARIALTMAAGRDPASSLHVHYTDLGALASLAEIFSAEAAATTPDVLVLDHLHTERSWSVATLREVIGHQSMRRAASQMYLHHSTLLQRVEWLEQHLGYPLRTPEGRIRGAVAWALWCIAHADR